MLIRLQKILNQAGIASRRKAEEYIVQGRVSVDGKTITVLGEKADPLVNRICVDGRQIRNEKKIYILLNKPKGYLCTAEDTHNRPIVYDLLKGVKERVFTVGRLDLDTEGLIILTNDGEFANRLMHPSYQVEKEYKARIDKDLNIEDRKRLERGIIIEGSRTAPCRIKVLDNPRKVSIILKEGKKRQIRQMLEIFGYRVLELVRIRIGNLILRNLKPGEFRYMQRSEVEGIIKTVK